MNSSDFDLALYRGYWHLGCHRRELPESGDFIRFDTPAGDVVIFNDDGELTAFDNRCPHRGATIYEQDHGRQPFTCGYHGWAYRRGNVIVPDRSRFEGCQLQGLDLNKLRLEYCGDFLFFAVDPVQELEDQLGGVYDLVQDISMNIDRRLDFSRYDYGCYWPLAVENALEPYHIGLVHPNSLALLQLEEGVNEFHGVNSVWYAPIGAGRVKRQLERLRNYFQIDFQYEGYMSIYLFPFGMISSTYGYSYSVQNFLPARAGSDTTRFTSRLLTATTRDAAAAGVMASFFESTAQVNRQVFEEDHGICRRMRKETWSFDPLRYASPAEAKLQHFRASCRMAVGATA